MSQTDDLIQQQVAGLQPSVAAYQQGLKNYAPNVANLSNAGGYQSLADRSQYIAQASAQFQPAAAAAAGAQNLAFQQYMNAANGGGPSVAALQQQQALQNAQGAGAAVAAENPPRDGRSAAAQFLHMMHAQNNAQNHAVAQGGQNRLQEITQALQGAGGVANNYATNQIQQNNINAARANSIANYMNGVAGAAARQNLGAQQAGLDYLQGLGAAANGGTAAALNNSLNQANFNNAITQGLASGLGSYLSSKPKPQPVPVPAVSPNTFGVASGADPSTTGENQGSMDQTDTNDGMDEAAV